jgi:hypothetical protein
MIKTEIFEGRELKVLNLIIKQHYFDAILDGRKVQEFREVRPTTIKNLLQIDEDGYEVEDEKGNSQPIKYDAIRFYVGYNKDRDTALVEVKDAYCEIFVDDNKEAITYEYGKDPKTGEPMTWIAEQVVFNLGKILETDLHKHDKI